MKTPEENLKEIEKIKRIIDTCNEKLPPFEVVKIQHYITSIHALILLAQEFLITGEMTEEEMKEYLEARDIAIHLKNVFDAIVSKVATRINENDPRNN